MAKKDAVLTLRVSAQEKEEIKKEAEIREITITE